MRHQLSIITKYLTLYPIALTLYTKVTQILLNGKQGDPVFVDILDHETPQRITTHLELMQMPFNITQTHKLLLKKIKYVKLQKQA